MINVIQNEDVYNISFKYDPLLISLVKNVPGRRWVPESKIWTIPKERLGFFLNQVRGTDYEPFVKIVSNEHLNENASLDVTAEIPQIDLKDVPFHVAEGFKPYAHQLDFMKFAIDRQLRNLNEGFLLCDDQGLGKTLEAYNLAEYNRTHNNFKHCLIICCINSSKYNWMNDIEYHSNGQDTPYIIGARKKRNGGVRYDTGSAEKLQDLELGYMYGDPKEDRLPYYLILNIEAIRYSKGKSYLISDQIIRMINEGSLNMIVIDEIHKNASMQSKQGTQISRIHKLSKNPVLWLPMTGTPITNSPLDLYLPLQLIGSHAFTSFYKWSQEFCVYGGFGGHEVVGYKNVPRLKAMLQANMLRRLKSDVLDLPPKIRYTEYVENTPYQTKLYNSVRMDLIRQKDSILSMLNPMVQLLRLRQVNGSPELVDEELPIDKSYISKNAKIKRLLELIDEATMRGEKVLVFSNWVQTLRTLYTFVSQRYKTCCFTGTMSPEDREKHKRVFQNNPEYKVLLGTIGAAGTTHTFTAASTIIFYDEPWTPSDKAQAEDRAYRIGTTKPVTIFTLITKDTVDDKVNQILYTKQGISNYIVDNKVDIHNDPKLFDLLLSDQ